MKTKLISFLQKLVLPAARIFCVLFSCASIFFILWLPYSDLLLVFTDSEYFWFDGRRIALTSTFPLFIFLIVYILITISPKVNKPSKKTHRRVNIFTLLIFSIFIALNATSVLFYLYLAIFTEYKPCEDPKMQDYFVTEYSICKTIVNNEFKW